MYCYRPQKKLREGNDFTPVCDSVHRGVSVQGVSVQGGSLSSECSLSMGVSVRETPRMVKGGQYASY